MNFKSRYLLVLVVITAFTIGNAYSQSASRKKTNTIKGIVIEGEDSKGIGYATVALYKDSIIKNAVATDESGKFSLKADTTGSYVLTVTYVGYSPYNQNFTVEDDAKEVDLGAIKLEKGLEVEAVTVIGVRPLVTTEVDKIIYNTEADPQATTSTALEMMRKVPLLAVDGDDKITLKGQANFKILVNGKTSNLMDKNYKEVLKSMPAHSIKNVEIITNPPSKYDAEGIGGIINIITNRKSLNGFNGSIGAGVDSYGGLNGNAYIAAALGKFSISANYYGGQYKQPRASSESHIENYNSEEMRYGRLEGSGKYKGTNNSISVDASYEIDTLNLISMSFGGYFGNSKNHGSGISEYLNSQRQQTMFFRLNNNSKNEYGSLSGNLDYQRSFKKPDRTFTVSYKIDYNPNNSSYDNMIEDRINYTEPSRRSENEAWGLEHTFQADYFDPITEKHQFETGVKYRLRPSMSNADNYMLDQNGVWQPEDRNKNDLDYRQHIGAAYLGYLLKFKKASFKVGARGEYTVEDGTFHLQNTDPHIFSRYFDLIPYANVAYKFNDKNNMRLSYTQRLQRPGIWYLNPYVNDQNPLDISYGNPNLKSEVGHSFGLSYGFYTQRFNMNLSGNATLINNSIDNVSEVRADGVKVTTYDNIGKNQNYGMNLWSSANFFERKLNINLGGGTRYSKIESRNGNGLSNSGWTYNANLNIYATPWKNGGVFLGGGYNSGYISLQNKSSNYYYHYLGVQHGFFDKKLNLSVNVNSPFENKRSYKNETTGVGFMQRSEFRFEQRSVRVSLDWRFGKMQTQVKKARRGISNDDTKSGGGGGGAAGGGGSN